MSFQSLVEELIEFQEKRGLRKAQPAALPVHPVRQAVEADRFRWEGSDVTFTAPMPKPKPKPARSVAAIAREQEKVAAQIKLTDYQLLEAEKARARAMIADLRASKLDALSAAKLDALCHRWGDWLGMNGKQQR
jgi:hypothetical protein